MEPILHPLALINISDHLSRERCCSFTGQHHVFGSPNEVVVLGALLGIFDGRQLLIINSFAIALSKGSSEVFDKSFFESRLSQYQEVFPQLELIGWYAATAESANPTPIIRQFLRDSSCYCDSPYILTIRDDSNLRVYSHDAMAPCGASKHQHVAVAEAPSSSSTVKSKSKISVQLFDRVSCLSSMESLKEIQFKLDSGDAERISLSEVMSKSVHASAAMLDTEGGQLPVTADAASIVDPLSTHLETWNGAADALKCKIDGALEFLRQQLHPDRQKGNCEKSRQILNELSSVCHAIEREKLKDKRDEEEAILIQSVLSDCSSLTALTSHSLKRLVEVKSQLSHLTGGDAAASLPVSASGGLHNHHVSL